MKHVKRVAAVVGVTAAALALPLARPASAMYLFPDCYPWNQTNGSEQAIYLRTRSMTYSDGHGWRAYDFLLFNSGSFFRYATCQQNF